MAVFSWYENSSSFWVQYLGRSLDPGTYWDNLVDGSSLAVGKAYAKGVYMAPIKIGDAIIHPIRTAQGLIALPGLLSSGQLKCLLGQKWDEFQRASAQRQGEMLGELLGDAAGGWATGGGVVKGLAAARRLRGSNVTGLIPQNEPGATLLGEYRRYQGQGFTAAQARYLAQPYPLAAKGHHFIPRNRRAGLLRWVDVPESVIEHPLNVMGRGMSRGRFYERHFKADPDFSYARFPNSIGGDWDGYQIGLLKAQRPFNLWYGAPDWLREVVIAPPSAGLIGGTIYISDDVQGLIGGF